MISAPDLRKALGLAALAALGVAAAVLPSARMVRKADSAIRAANAELGQLSARPAQLEAQAAALAAAAAYARQHTKPIPAQGDVAGLVRGLSVYLDDLGVKSREVATGVPVRAGGLVCMPMSLTMRSDSAAVLAVLRHVESLPRLTRLRRLKISVDKPADTPPVSAEHASDGPSGSPLVKSEILLELIFTADAADAINATPTSGAAHAAGTGPA